MEQFHVDIDATAGNAPGPSFNVAPTTDVLVVVESKEHRRQLSVMRWGLVPSWAKDASMASRMINARAETVATKPSFRHAFAKQRCIVPADGFYEWQAGHVDSAGKPRKQPFFVRPVDGTSLPMAGLYELWHDPSKFGQDDEILITCTILTTRATDEFASIHDRMPVVIQSRNWDAWLDRDLTNKEQVASLLEPAGALELELYPVGTAVNSVRNNSVELTRPL